MTDKETKAFTPQKPWTPCEKDCPCVSNKLPNKEDCKCGLCGRCNPITNRDGATGQNGHSLSDNKEDCGCEGIVMCKKHGEEFMIKHPPIHSDNFFPSDKIDDWQKNIKSGIIGELADEPYEVYVTSDKTWEERFDEKFEVLETDPEIRGVGEEIKQFISNLLTSDTIKAKEEVLRDLVSKIKNNRTYAIVGESSRMAKMKNAGWHDAVIDIKKYAKSLGINLEEPSK